MAIKRGLGLFKTKAKKAEAQKEDSALNKHFNRVTSEYEVKALEEPHHSGNCDNVVLRSESPSCMCVNLRTVVASNNWAPD